MFAKRKKVLFHATTERKVGYLTIFSVKPLGGGGHLSFDGKTWSVENKLVGVCVTCVQKKYLEAKISKRTSLNVSKITSLRGLLFTQPASTSRIFFF